jgi:hypothetical protein
MSGCLRLLNLLVGKCPKVFDTSSFGSELSASADMLSTQFVTQPAGDPNVAKTAALKSGLLPSLCLQTCDKRVTCFHQLGALTA